MKWNEEEMLAEINAYFDRTSKEQLLKDLEESGSLHMIELVVT